MRAGGEMSAHSGAGVGRGPQAGVQQVSKVSTPGSQEWVAGMAGAGQTAANTSRAPPSCRPGHGSSRRGTCTAGGHLRWESAQASADDNAEPGPEDSVLREARNGRVLLQTSE